MKKIIIASCVTLCATSFALAEEGSSKTQQVRVNQAQAVQASAVAPIMMPQITTGDKVIDEKLKVLIREREEKLRAISEEYQAKIKALIGERVARMMPPQMASGTPVMATTSGERRGFVNGERNGMDNGQKNGVPFMQASSTRQGGSAEVFLKLKTRFLGFFGVDAKGVNTENIMPVPPMMIPQAQ